MESYLHLLKELNLFHVLSMFNYFITKTKITDICSRFAVLSMFVVVADLVLYFISLMCDAVVKAAPHLPSRWHK